MKGKNLQSRLLYPARISLRFDGEIKSFTDKQRHVLIKLTKIKFKEKILKATGEKQKITYKGIPIKLSADFSAETLQARKVQQDILKVMKEKKLQPRLPSKDLIQIQWRNQKLFRQAGAKLKKLIQMGNPREAKDLQKQTQNN